MSFLSNSNNVSLSYILFHYVSSGFYIILGVSFYNLILVNIILSPLSAHFWYGITFYVEFFRLLKNKDV